MNNSQGALGYGYIDTVLPITSRPNHQDDGQPVRLYYGDWVAVLAVRSSSYLVCTERKEEVWVACDQVKLIITPDLVDRLVAFLDEGSGMRNQPLLEHVPLAHRLRPDEQVALPLERLLAVVAEAGPGLP